MPPIQATGRMCGRAAATPLPRVNALNTCQVATSHPAQAASPNGSPMPQITMFTNGNTNGVRFAHWCVGGISTSSFIVRLISRIFPSHLDD